MPRTLTRALWLISVAVSTPEVQSRADTQLNLPQPASGKSLIRLAESQEGAAPSTRSSRRRGARSTTYKVAEVKNGGVVTGIVQYKGPVPAPRKIQIVKDHETCKQHPVDVPLMKVNKENCVAEAVVYFVDIAEGKDWPKSDSSPIIDQKACDFHPHVQIVRVKQPVQIVNSDPVAHNINASQRIFTLFNILQPQQGMKATQQFEKPGIVNLRCNVHDWMQAFVHVAAHPYYATTGDNGAFRLEDIPPGKYQLGIWQEHLGEQVFEVDVKPGETTEMNIVLKPLPGDDGKVSAK